MGQRTCRKRSQNVPSTTKALVKNGTSNQRCAPDRPWTGGLSADAVSDSNRRASSDSKRTEKHGPRSPCGRGILHPSLKTRRVVQEKVPRKIQHASNSGRLLGFRPRIAGVTGGILGVDEIADTCGYSGGATTSCQQGHESDESKRGRLGDLRDRSSRIRSHL